MRYAIAHAAWADGRARGLKRLLGTLGRDAEIFRSEAPEHATVWAHRIWEWAASQHEPTCVLNDDIRLICDFPLILEAIASAIPDRNLSLHFQGQDAPRLARAGHRHLRAYDLTGPAYVLTPESARSMVEFWNANPALQNKKDLNEDNVAAQWAWDKQQPFWAPLPSLVKHDVSIPSTLGYDHHKDRQTSVAWDEPWWPPGMLTQMSDPDYWRVPDGHHVPLIENPWFSSRHLAMLRRQRRGILPPPKPCAFCAQRNGVFASDATGASMCLPCTINLSNALEGYRESASATGTSDDPRARRETLNLGTNPAAQGSQNTPWPSGRDGTPGAGSR
jgi:hypothetical protein